MALTDLTRISTSGIATGSTIDSPILRKDVNFRGSQVGVTSALFDSSDDALEFNDNVKLKFGNSGDLELYHDTSNGSYIKEAGPGALRIQGDAGIWMQSTGNQDRITADNDAVNLFSGGTKRFNTTSTGAVVTGILTATSFSGPVVGNTNNASGISTFYDLRVSNNLTVEGTTTTLDTNLIGVDRVEVGANSNTVTGIAVTQSGTADIVRLYDGSTQVVTVDDTGKVGIGSAIPTGTLTVHGLNGGNPGIMLRRDTGGGDIASISWGSNTSTFAKINYRDAAPHGLQFYSGGTASSNLSMIIRLNGNVGIGTDIPDKTFVVKGSGGNFVGEITNTGTSVSNNGLFVTTANNNSSTILFAASSGGSEKFRIRSDGAIGINTTGNYSDIALSIFGADVGEGTAKGQLILKDTAAYDASPTAGIIFQGIHAAGSQAIFAGIRGFKENASNGNYAGALAFDVRANGAVAYEAARITSAGNLGIGITNPNSSWKTHIKSSSFGLLRLETTLTGSDAPYLEFYHNSTSPADNDELGIIQFKGKNTNNDDHTYAYMMVKSTDVSDGSEDGDILFATAGGGVTAERLRIDSTGRLLLNNISSRAVANITAQVQLEGTTANTSAISIVRNSASEYPPYLNFGKSRATSTGGTTIVNDDDSLGQIRFSGADGNDLTNHAASIEAFIDGTPANNVTPGRLIFSTTSATGSDATEKFRISSNGQVCIGSGFVGGGGHLTIRSGGVNSYATQDYQYVGTPSDNDTLAQIRFTANTTGASVIQGAVIKAVADDDWSTSGDAPTRLEFHTAPNDSATMVNRMTITELGDVYAGNAAYGGYAIFDNSTTRPRFQFRQGTGTNRGTAFIETRGDANSMSLYIAKSREGNGTGVISSGDQLGSIQFTGADGTNQVTGAQILAYTSGTIAADRIPTNLSFYTHPDSTAGKKERLRINSDGQIIKLQDTTNRTSLKTYSGEGLHFDHYQYQSSGTYRRYADIVSVGDGSWGSYMRFFTMKDGGTAKERLRIQKDGGVYMRTQGGFTKEDGSLSSGVGYDNRTRLYPYWISETGACRFHFSATANSGIGQPRFWLFTNGTNHLTGKIEIGMNQRTNSPTNARFRNHQSTWQVAMYGEGDNDGSSMRYIHLEGDQRGSTKTTTYGQYYVSSNGHSEYGTNDNQYQDGYGGWYWKMDSGSDVQAHRFHFDCYFSGGGFNTWYMYIDQ